MGVPEQDDQTGGAVRRLGHIGPVQPVPVEDAHRDLRRVLQDDGPQHAVQADVAVPDLPGQPGAVGLRRVASAVAAPYNDGAITYVEYGYAKQRGFPVASVKNAAGYFSQPTAGNVAIALTRAQINQDRTQVLDDVYRNPDPAPIPSRATAT